ncbi:MAG: NAD(P)/FAD-dependent oxidoreductase [Lachnospiraceae bacterium]|nr:NAD(P)/FAD-dependent oxidoreductase [Lachnospiraceae bacterium]
MDIVIIGGGAAGMMCACIAARKLNKSHSRSHRIIIIEKNEKLGKKLFITGKGRCNLTNAADIEDFFRQIKRNPKFMYSSLYGFTNDDVISFFNSLGVRTKVERGNRVFPESDKSSDIIDALKRDLKKNQVEVWLNTEVRHLMVSDGKCIGVLLSDGEQVFSDKCIVATGGLSYQSTGSTGDGYRFARENGIKVTDLSPSLVPLNIKEDLTKKLMGLSLKNIGLKIKDESDKKVLYEDFGEMMFTHFGVTGPIILSASSAIKGDSIKNVSLHLDLKNALSEKQLDLRLIREFGGESLNKNKEFKNSLDQLFPSKLIPVMIELSGIDPKKRCNEITKGERASFGTLIKDFRLTVAGRRGFDEAVVTSGGVAVNEIDPSTMESKKIRNLYFVGEVLDIDAMTGGFNLQIAWSTAAAAGRAAIS